MRLPGARVLSTRPGEHGTTVRRYELPDGRRVSTIELPLTVVDSVGQATIEAVLEQFHRDAEKVTLTLRQRVENLLGPDLSGKPIAIASELGCSESWVRRIRTELRPPPLKWKP